MARVQYGVIVTELKGKIQGQVFQGGNVGFVLRNKGYTPGISTSQRQSANALLVSQATAWRLLNDTQRAAWAAIVSAWTFTDKFGNSYQGSPFQVFVSYNSTLLSLSQPAVSVPGSPVTPTDPGTVTVAFDDGPDYSIDWVNSGSTNDCLAAFISVPISPGRNLNHLRLIKSYGDSINGVNGIGADAAFVAKFGELPLGATVGVKYAFYDKRFPRPFFGATVRTVVTHL